MSVLGTRYLNKPWTRTNDVPIWRVTNGTEICLITISSRPPFIFISFTIYEFVGNLRSFEASFFSTNYKSTTHQYVIAHVPLNVNFSCIFSDILKIESISININHKIINNNPAGVKLIIKWTISSINCVMQCHAQTIESQTIIMKLNCFIVTNETRNLFVNSVRDFCSIGSKMMVIWYTYRILVRILRMD